MKNKKLGRKLGGIAVRAAIVGAAALLVTGCGAKAEEGSKAAYISISMEDAKEIMQSASDHLIVDVRRADEFAEGHIPGAVNVPNEDIQKGQTGALDDKGRLLLIYCRTGRRSKEAAKKLAELGYTDVREFGGITDWDGDIEK